VTGAIQESSYTFSEQNIQALGRCAAGPLVYVHYPSEEATRKYQVEIHVIILNVAEVCKV
jgi:hypothetical protein